jgi:hypothetical protein
MGVQEGLVVRHDGAHVMSSPFEDLGVDVFHEGIGLPSSQDYYPVTTRMVMEGEDYRGMRSRSLLDSVSLLLKIILWFAAQV